MKNTLKKILIPQNTLFVLVFLIFTVKGFVFLDPDFGWRIKAGEIYLTQGIPDKDPFSYTMPSFPWVDHAYIQTAFFYFIYSKIGYLALALFYSFFTILSLYILSLMFIQENRKPIFRPDLDFVFQNRFIKPIYVKLKHESFGVFTYFPYILGISIILTFFGIRAQVLSWLFISFLYFNFLSVRRWDRYKKFLPLFFLFWANLHGSFAIGLAALYIFIFLRFLRTKKFNKKDIIISLLSSLITVINPYGLGLWREVYSSVSDTSLRFSIAEWMPSLLMVDLAMVFFLASSFGLITKYRKRIQLEYVGVYFFFLISAVLSRRHLPLLVFIGVPLTISCLKFLWSEASLVKKGKERFTIINGIAFLFAIVFFLIQLLFAFRESIYLGYGEFYPKKAVNFLKQNPFEGELFSDYGWGGYLIHNMPEKRVFIDGRMPSWRRENPPEGELANAYKTYNDIIKGETEYKSIFDEFDINLVLWRKPKEGNFITDFMDRMETYLAVFGWEKQDFDFLESLKSNGYLLIYEDEIAQIYKRRDL